VPMSNDAFLILSLVSTSFVGGAHFGMHSIAGIFYNSAIRANGTGWATSIAKIGAIAGPVIGAIILSSGMPIVRSFAILAICPALMVICISGIGLIASRRGKDAPVAKAVPAE
jgi:AAHS family 4-hydroxybenzoate transporter-like MFS transporter